jgi:hypothetical protein
MRTLVGFAVGSVLLAGAIIGFARSETPRKPQSQMDKLAFIAGAWERSAGKTRNEELWTPPSGGCMMGLMRQLTDGKVSVREYILIEETHEGILMSVKHLGPKMADIPGRSISLRLTSLENGKAVFENAGEGALKKVIYGPVTGDSMYAGIEVVHNEQLTKIDLPYQRVKSK